MGSIGNLNLNATGSNIMVQNQGSINKTNVDVNSEGNVSILNNGFMNNTASDVRGVGSGSVNIQNNGQMADVFSRLDGKENTFNFVNNGTTSDLNTKTYHGAVTNISNNGFVNNGNLFDSRDQTNVQNNGSWNNMALNGYWGGEFNVQNNGAINSLSTNNTGNRPGSMFNIDNNGWIGTANLNAQGGSTVNFNNVDGAMANLNANGQGGNINIWS